MSLIIMFASMIIGAFAASIAVANYDAGVLLALAVYAAAGTTFVLALLLSMYVEVAHHSDDYFM